MAVVARSERFLKGWGPLFAAARQISWLAPGKLRGQFEQNPSKEMGERHGGPYRRLVAAQARRRSHSSRRERRAKLDQWGREDKGGGVTTTSPGATASTDRAARL